MARLLEDENSEDTVADTRESRESRDSKESNNKQIQYNDDEVDLIVYTFIII